MTIDPPQNPFERCLRQVRVILAVWAKFVGSVFAITAVFGAVAPLAYAALLFTLVLPVILLTLWGFALDQKLQWGERDEGPW